MIGDMSALDRVIQSILRNDPTDYYTVLGGKHALAYPPEVGLVAAVLEGAIYEFFKYASSRRKAEKRAYDEACQWLFEDAHACATHTESRFTFEQICEVLGFDAAAVRAALQRCTTQITGGSNGNGSGV